MKLSVVIPVYNEINTVEEILRRVKKVKIEKEIIVVDDCSTDGTRDVLKELSGNGIKVLFHEKNMGKGAALRTGFKHLSGDIVIIQDADLEYYPEEYPQMIQLILEGKADVVYGSRFLGRHRVFMFSHYLGNKFLTFLTNLLYNSTLTDMETCYKAFRAEILKGLNLKSKSFGFEPEFTAEILKRKLRVYEIPISYDGRTYAEGKKITWKAGLVALYWLIRCRFTHFDINQETLDRMAMVNKYNGLIFDRIKGFLGKRVLEVGSGSGNITRYLLGRELLVATDVSDEYIDKLKRRFVENKRVKLIKYDLNERKNGRFKRYGFDSIVCLNVLEHIEDDLQVLRNMNDTLTNGRLILLVPAMKRLYGRLDEVLGHYRRYSKEDIVSKLRNSGFKTEAISYFNILGALGWFINSRILKKRILPGNQLRIFNRLVPLLKLERLLDLPFGLSLLVVAKKV